MNIAVDLVAEHRQRTACALLAERYQECTRDVFEMITCTPRACDLVRLFLERKRSRYDFERITAALCVARAALGLPPEGTA